MAVLAVVVATRLLARALRTTRRSRAATLVAIVVLLSPAWAFAILRVAKRGLPPLEPAARARYLDRWLPGHALLAATASPERPKPTVYGLGVENLHYFAPGRFLGDWNGPYRYAVVEPLLADPERLAAALRGMGVDLLLTRADRVAAGGAAAREPSGSAAPLRLLAIRDGFELWEVTAAPARAGSAIPRVRAVPAPPLGRGCRRRD